MLDNSKAFDRVNYCKLFAITLLERDTGISLVIIKLLLFMYTDQSLRMK